MSDGLIAPLNAPPGAGGVIGTQPGVTGGVIVANRVIIIGPGGELLVYSPVAGAGNLIASITGTAGTDSYGNTFVEGVAAYAAISGTVFALQLGTTSIGAGFFASNLTSPAAAPPAFGAGEVGPAGCIAVMYSGLSAGGSTAAEIQVLDSVAAGVANGGIALVAGSIVINGTVSINGSSDTGTGSNGGVTSGPSGTVNAFPAAGPNHTHAEAHTHPL
jgi:hypothetical protein